MVLPWYLNQVVFTVQLADIPHVIYDSSESEMKTYVTKKESLSLFTSARKQQRGKSYVKRGTHSEGGKTFDETVARILKEFGGEIVNKKDVRLYRVENFIW